MSKRAHRKKVKGNSCPLRKWILEKTTIGTKQYTNNKKEDIVKSPFNDSVINEVVDEIIEKGQYPEEPTDIEVKVGFVSGRDIL